IERTDVSATLGKDSLKQAKKAALIGLLVVALFLLVFYRFLGLIAVAGLAIYSALLYAAILLLNVTLTLPGFAGLILTIGVAADAATRAMLGLLAGFRWFDNPRFMGATGQTISDWQRIDVCGPKRRRIWLIAATVAIVLSVIVIAVKGLNLGIDFKGGTQVT